MAAAAAAAHAAAQASLAVSPAPAFLPSLAALATRFPATVKPMANSNSHDFLGGLLAGAVLGTVLGLVVAPRSGRATRQTLKKAANAVPDLATDLSTSAQLHSNRAATVAQRRCSLLLSRLQIAAAAGQAAYRREASRSTPPGEPERRRD